MYHTNNNHSNGVDKHQNNNVNDFKAKAVIVDSLVNENMIKAAEKIKSGGLVSFPTETVYGLGANAFDTNAVLSIFTAKGRPLTDPVIVHIVDAEFGSTLLELSERQRDIYNRLTSSFWPGALTIVAKASSLIPSIVTAQTGYVGVRYPKHEVAANLIKLSGLPIAAPSANRFGHVSPTSAIHVYDDLGNSDITILDTTAECKIGIESTVLKIIDDNNLVILRKGGVSERSIREALSNENYSHINITAINKSVSNNTTEGQEAPGQLLTHYAPDIQAYILKDIVLNNNNNNNNHSNTNNNNNSNNIFKLSECVFIDFGKNLVEQTKKENLQSSFLAYKDLSPNNQVLEAANCLFSTLRWSESVKDAKIILLPDLRADHMKSLEHSDAVFDRIFRAASGKTATLDLSSQSIFTN